MEAQPVIAVFDIGKTNKKLFLFDSSYHLVLERSAILSEVKDEDGEPSEDLEKLQSFIFEALREVSDLPDFVIKAINVSAYGASLVYIDYRGKVLAPLYNYLKAYPTDLSQLLYQRYGGVQQFSLTTASPALGSLNAGLQLFRIRSEQPDVFERTLYALHLPQYLSFLLSGKAYSDITSIGCHTSLWDFTQKRYHEWVDAEGLVEKLAPIEQGSFVSPALSPYDFEVGIGLHDSSAALIPYLALFKEPFALISTGTWCITLNPFNHTPLTTEELAQDCLCYMTYEGDPVKASRLFAGYEHSKQVSRIAAHFNTQEEKYKSLWFDPEIIALLQANVSITAGGSSDSASPAAASPVPKGHSAPTAPGDLATAGSASTATNGAGTAGAAPTATNGAATAAGSTSVASLGAFAHRDLTAFGSDVEAYHQLMLDLVSAQVEATNRVLIAGKVNKLFIDGGFSKNDLYMNLLARAYPAMEVYASAVAQASALGAALALHQVWNQGPVPDHLIELKRYDGQIESRSVR